MKRKKKSQKTVQKTRAKKSSISRAKIGRPKKKSAFLRRKTDLPFGDFLVIESDKKTTSKTSKAKKNNFFRRADDFERLAELSDSELIEVIKKQNSEAYRELFQRYQRKLFVYLYHLVGNKDETEDIIQIVFTKTYRSINNFDQDRKFSSWIYRIAHNEAINFLKRKNKKYFISWEDVSLSKDKLDISSNEMPMEEKWMHEEITRDIDAALDGLPAKYKEILTMRYFSEYSYEQIAKMLNRPINTVGTLINRAKKKLFEVVQENNKVK